VVPPDLVILLDKVLVVVVVALQNQEVAADQLLQ
jgi:hypothetical protein